MSETNAEDIIMAARKLELLYDNHQSLISAAEKAANSVAPQILADGKNNAFTRIISTFMIEAGKRNRRKAEELEGCLLAISEVVGRSCRLSVLGAEAEQPRLRLVGSRVVPKTVEFDITPLASGLEPSLIDQSPHPSSPPIRIVPSLYGRSTDSHMLEEVPGVSVYPSEVGADIVALRWSDVIALEIA